MVAFVRAGVPAPRVVGVSSGGQRDAHPARRDAVVTCARGDPRSHASAALMSLAASSIVLAHPSAAQAETLREMTVAAGNAAFLEKEFTDLKYAGVKTVVPGLAATEPGSDPVEAVRVTYDADKISHETLMRTYWQHADPVNANGSFKESGARFKGAVWVADPAERAEVETNRARLERSGIFGSDGTSKKSQSPRAFVNVPVLDAPPASFEPFPEETRRSLTLNPKGLEKEAKARNAYFKDLWGFVQFCADKVCGYVRFAPRCTGECLDVFPQYRARNAGVPELEGDIKITGGSK
jgi:hypothetical protein